MIATSFMRNSPSGDMEYALLLLRRRITITNMHRANTPTMPPATPPMTPPTDDDDAGVGLEGGVVVEKVRHLETGFGLNAATGEYVDMIKAGIIDPAKVTRSALQNAASIAALFLTTEAVIADKPEKNPAPAQQGGGDMDF